MPTGVPSTALWFYDSMSTLQVNQEEWTWGVRRSCCSQWIESLLLCMMEAVFGEDFSLLSNPDLS